MKAEMIGMLIELDGVVYLVDSDSGCGRSGAEAHALLRYLEEKVAEHQFDSAA